MMTHFPSGFPEVYPTKILDGAILQAKPNKEEKMLVENSSSSNKELCIGIQG